MALTFDLNTLNTPLRNISEAAQQPNRRSGQNCMIPGFVNGTKVNMLVKPTSVLEPNCFVDTGEGNVADLFPARLDPVCVVIDDKEQTFTRDELEEPIKVNTQCIDMVVVDGKTVVERKDGSLYFNPTKLDHIRSDSILYFQGSIIGIVEKETNSPKFLADMLCIAPGQKVNTDPYYLGCLQKSEGISIKLTPNCPLEIQTLPTKINPNHDGIKCKEPAAPATTSEEPPTTPQAAEEQQTTPQPAEEQQTSPQAEAVKSTPQPAATNATTPQPTKTTPPPAEEQPTTAQPTEQPTTPQPAEEQTSPAATNATTPPLAEEQPTTPQPAEEQQTTPQPAAGSTTPPQPAEGPTTPPQPAEKPTTPPQPAEEQQTPPPPAATNATTPQAEAVESTPPPPPQAALGSTFSATQVTNASNPPALALGPSTTTPNSEGHGLDVWQWSLVGGGALLILALCYIIYRYCRKSQAGEEAKIGADKQFVVDMVFSEETNQQKQILKKEEPMLTKAAFPQDLGDESAAGANNEKKAAKKTPQSPSEPATFTLISPIEGLQQDSEAGLDYETKAEVEMSQLPKNPAAASLGPTLPQSQEGAGVNVKKAAKQWPPG